MTAAPDPLPVIPQATTAPRRRFSWLWLLPASAAIVTFVLLVRIPFNRGTHLTIRFDSGNGLHPGDSLRHRGVQIGAVERVVLDEEGASVQIDVLLDPSAEPLARSGSRFWVVRPVFSLAGTSGLETMIGPRYLAIEPGNGFPTRSFVGLESPPVLTGLEAGGIEVVLDAPSRSGLRAGAPVTYRQMDVGRVMTVALSSDANAVEARCYIEPAYAGLVRKKTRFWASGGIEINAGLFNGLRVEVDSIQALLAGGVAFATPPEGGAAMATGSHFTLFRRAEPEWLEWRPSLPVGPSLLPDGAVIPRLIKIQLGWKSGPWWMDRERARSGWAIPVGDTVLVPADLVEEPPDAHPRSGVVRSATGEVPVANLKPEVVGNGIRKVRLPGVVAAGAPLVIRSPGIGQDYVLITDPQSPPRPLAAGAVDGEGIIDPVADLDSTAHGAAVLARGDGALIGVVSVGTDGKARLLPIPEPAKP